MFFRKKVQKQGAIIDKDGVKHVFLGCGRVGICSGYAVSEKTGRKYPCLSLRSLKYSLEIGKVKDFPSDTCEKEHVRMVFSSIESVQAMINALEASKKDL